MIGPNQIYPKGYCLSLSDGSEWRITGYEDGICLADKLAFVMRLKECSASNSPLLVFFEKTNDIINEDHINLFRLKMPDSEADWRMHDFSIFRIWHDSTFSNVIAQSLLKEYRYNDEYYIIWYVLHLIYQRSMKKGGLPFHAGAVEYKDHGILLSAKSGTGKSTCCRRLPSHWKALCDDEALVVLDVNGKYRVHPFPTWSNYLTNYNHPNTWQVEHSVPVSAIFFLEQSDIDEAIPLDANQSAMLIANSATQACNTFITNIKKEYQTEFMREAFNNAFEIAKAIPAYRLRVSLNGRFWEEIEKVLPL
jgi:SynChlorMet cassette protein ScmC